MSMFVPLDIVSFQEKKKKPAFLQNFLNLKHLLKFTLK